MPCDIGPRQTRIEFPDHARHTRLMFAPECGAERAFRCGRIVLDADRLMGQPVALFQHPVRLGRFRPANAGQRQQGDEQPYDEEKKKGGMQPERRGPKEADPAGGEKQKNERGRDEHAWQQLFGQKNRTGEESLRRQHPGERLRFWRFILPELRHPPKLPFDPSTAGGQWSG